MGGEWREARLGQLGEVNRGRSRHRPRDAAHLYGGAYPFIQTGDIKASGGRITSHSQTYSEAGLAQSRLWPEGTMVITIAANIAETAILTYPACFPDSVVGFIADKQRGDVRFVEYLFRHLRRQIQHENVGTGSVQDNINLQTLARLTLRVPEPHEQRRIAHVLGTLDDKIENNRKTAKTLEAMAQAIFKSWFVDFDPVRAKMAGESRESICKRLKLTPEILDLFPDRLVDSELGEIPEGWGVGTFGDFAGIVGGSTPSTTNPEYWFSGTHSWATPKDLSNLTMPVLLATENKITDAGLQQISSRLLPVGTVLLSSRAPIGYLAITEIPVAINQGFIALRPNRDNMAVFLLFLMKNKLEEIISRANGSTFLEISKSKFRPIPVLVPPENVLAAFNVLANPLYRMTVLAERSTIILSKQRDTLLPKLVSGEIRIPEDEEPMTWNHQQ
ncbi:restriction endonuclease subunit S [Acidithiobacillus sulfuriphilus]|uniref:Restriction endonuclease subunit S n=2 Tax=Acidithiobacillus sulfuriphilus TaxID=1867749 RepID=A0A3M8QUC2_9PROT|nr:restriction endonuclease subunit S [Acidithiobacillus sulfuriphilus]RNF59797.1 restriction endonuclease subunit S [Acidithiobacillus sulfuriphilus]